MICPNKICKQEMPEDSVFCDQCGVQLFRCAKCGFVSASKFCGKCGGPMSAIEPSVGETPTAATIVVALPSEKIFLCHTEGWKLEIAGGDILGRTNGPHAAQLGKFPIISSNHAKITRSGSDWFITDLRSTNKTYVNGAKLEGDVPVKIKQNDVVLLANITFTVRE
jgi:hypothetical protein